MSKRTGRFKRAGGAASVIAEMAVAGAACRDGAGIGWTPASTIRPTVYA